MSPQVRRSMASTIISRRNAIQSLNTGTRVGLILVITAVAFVVVGVIIMLTLKWYRRRYYQSLSQRSSQKPNPYYNHSGKKQKPNYMNNYPLLDRGHVDVEREVMIAKSLASRESLYTTRHSRGHFEDWDDDFSQRGSILSDMKELEANIKTGGRASLEYHPVFKQASEPRPSQLSQQYTPPHPLEVESPRPLVTKPKLASLPRAATAPVFAASRSELPSHSRQVHPSQRKDMLPPRRLPHRSMSEDITKHPSRRHVPHFSESHVTAMPRRGTFDAVPEEYVYGTHRPVNGTVEHNWI